MATQYTEEFKNDAVRYWKEHPELGIAKCAKMRGQSQPEEGGILRVMMQRNLHACVKSYVIHKML